GVCALTPWGLWRALGIRRQAARPVAIAAALGIAALAFATVQRNAVWSSHETLWRDGLAKAPAHPRPNTNLGMALAIAGRNEEALGYYSRAAELDPDFQEAHHNAGVALHLLGRLDDAKRELERALELEPNDRFTHWTLGQVLIAQGNVAGGIAQLEQGAKMGKEPLLWFELGRRLAAQGRLEDAEQWLAYAVAIDRANPEMHAVLGSVLIARGDLGRGAGHLGLSLNVRESAIVRAQLARAVWARGQWTAALAHAERALKSGADRLEVVATLAWMLATSPDAAQRDPQRALELVGPFVLDAEASGKRTDPRLLEAAAAALASGGVLDRAERLLLRALEESRASGLLGVASSVEDGLERLRRGESMVETSATAAARMGSGSWSPE
ncbi:MAG: tetratricopeptide repeat protein, partial [Myxococcota bacterium]|nr:tetratricopeptide repeat protein [Myxococcota bacterium]